MNKKVIISFLMVFFAFMNLNAADTHVAEDANKTEYVSKSFPELLSSLYQTTGINAFLNPSDDVMTAEANPKYSRPMTHFEQTWGRIIMFGIVFVLFLWGLEL